MYRLLACAAPAWRRAGCRRSEPDVAGRQAASRSVRQHARVRRARWCAPRAGFLPFSAIYIELHYIFSSIWGHKARRGPPGSARLPPCAHRRPLCAESDGLSIPYHNPSIILPYHNSIIVPLL